MTSSRTEFLLALSFLTRLPVPPAEYSDDAMVGATRFYPLIGLGLGILLAALFSILSLILPNLVAVLLTTAVAIAITGALHEDGLADTGDGLGGGWSKEQALEIMRDSRIGTYGALTLGVTLALKVIALAALPTLAAAGAIVAGHTFGRLAITRVISMLDYVRETGAGDILGKTHIRQGLLPWAATAVAAVLLGFSSGWMATIAAIAATAVVVYLMVSWLKHKLGGFTGDTLGATEQLVEAVIPLAILACL